MKNEIESEALVVDDNERAIANGNGSLSTVLDQEKPDTSPIEFNSIWRYIQIWHLED